MVPSASMEMSPFSGSFPLRLIFVANVPNLSSASNCRRLIPSVLTFPLNVRCLSSVRLRATLPASVASRLLVVTSLTPVPLTKPFMWIFPKRVTTAGTSTCCPFRFSEMKLMVLSESLRSLMSASQVGSDSVRFLTHPSMLTSMSPVVELTKRSETSMSSPRPRKNAESSRVLLNVLNDGSRHARSDNVMVDGSMLPL